MASATFCLAVGLLLVRSAVASLPICSDTSSYQHYPNSTKYKGLNDDTGWDRGKNETCDVVALSSSSSDTCGDCDFRLNGSTWYRFSDGPYVKLVEFDDNSACPPPNSGSCNGYSQISLIKTDVAGSDDKHAFHGWMKTTHDTIANNATCDVYPTNQTDTQYMLESYDCVTFMLYKFFTGWENAEDQFCTEIIANTTYPISSSFCMDDTEVALTVQVAPDMKYYSPGASTLVTCTATRSPTPPSIVWTNAANATVIPSTLVVGSSNVYTHAYSVDTAAYSSISCISGPETKSLYSVSVAAEDATGTAGEALDTECRITLDTFQAAEQGDLYMMETVDGVEQFYTSDNKSNIVVSREGAGTFLLTLQLTSGETDVPATARNSTQDWGCGIRDPLTGSYIRASFTITLKRVCDAGEGFKGPTCQECEENTFSEASQCEACPAEQVSEAGSTDRSQCKCPEDTFLEGGSNCTACPTGQHSDVGSIEKSQCNCPEDQVYKDGACKKEGTDPKIHYIIGGTVAAVFLIALAAGIVGYRLRRRPEGDVRMSDLKSRS